MKRNIIITESQLDLIKEFENKEILFHQFEAKVKNYLKELCNKPTNPTFDEFFKDNDIQEDELQNKLMDLGILNKKKEGFDEPEDANGKKHSVHYKQFSVKNNNFDANMRKLYDTYFNDGRRKAINEEGEGGMGGGALGDGNLCNGTSDPAGGATFGTGFINRGSFYKPKKAKSITDQESNVDMSPAMSRKDGKGGSISIPKQRK